MRTARFSLTILSTIVLLFGGMAASQVVWKMKASIPFNFSVGTKTFPAGEYEVRSIGRNRMALDDSQSHFLTYAMTIGVEGSDPGAARLDFIKDGDRYFLFRIWNGGESYGLELAQSNMHFAHSVRKPAMAEIYMKGTP